VTDVEFETQALAAMRDAGATEYEIVRETETMASRYPVIGVRCIWRGERLEMTTMRKSSEVDVATMRRTLAAIRMSLR
jgi:hypothetical protein